MSGLREISAVSLRITDPFSEGIGPVTVIPLALEAPSLIRWSELSDLSVLIT